MVFQSNFKENMESRIDNIKLLCEEEFRGQRKELRVLETCVPKKQNTNKQTLINV